MLRIADTCRSMIPEDSRTSTQGVRMSIKSSRSHAFFQQNRCCFYCRFPMWESNITQFCATHDLSRREAMRYECTAEHLIPRQDGGRNERRNIVAACKFCNQTRHRAKLPLAASEYKSRVRRRIERGRWHPREHHRMRRRLTRR